MFMQSSLHFILVHLMTSETSRMTILIFLKKEFLVELIILIYLPAIVVKISPIVQKKSE